MGIGLRGSISAPTIQFLISQNSRARFTMIFDLGPNDQVANVTRPTINESSTSSLAQIAQVVAQTGQLFNIIDINTWIIEHTEISFDDELKQTQAILCMPIINGQKNVIGVVQLINKVGIPSHTDDPLVPRHLATIPSTQSQA